MSHRANYALCYFGELLGPDEAALDVPWAEFAGNRTTEASFEIPAEPVDPYLELQAYEVGAFGHEIRVNDQSLSGFDIPPADGWQQWMDAITGVDLRVGENTLRVVHDGESDDSFVVGNVVVHWKETVK